MAVNRVAGRCYVETYPLNLQRVRVKDDESLAADPAKQSVLATASKHVLGYGDIIRRYQNISTTNPLLLPWQDFGTSTGRVTIVTLWPTERLKRRLNKVRVGGVLH
ncbi:hypothetical protein BGY98DRAFT_961014 [Russula aff. rugulosa BPL654]|nr:hypothetical protein BGY98DRAFT_961014 [Russula aff. rugulosa BPL654]